MYKAWRLFRQAVTASARVERQHAKANAHLHRHGATLKFDPPEAGSKLLLKRRERRLPFGTFRHNAHLPDEASYPKGE